MSFQLFEYNEISDWLNGKSINDMFKSNIDLATELIKI